MWPFTFSKAKRTKLAREVSKVKVRKDVGDPKRLRKGMTGTFDGPYNRDGSGSKR
jgi:hypothetical protein